MPQVGSHGQKTPSLIQEGKVICVLQSNNPDKTGRRLTINYSSSVTKGTASNKDSDSQGPRPKLAWFCYCYRNSPLLSQKPLECLSLQSRKDQFWCSEDLTALTASTRKLLCKKQAGENKRNNPCFTKCLPFTERMSRPTQPLPPTATSPNTRIVLLPSSSPPGEVPPLLPFTLHPRTCLINCIPAWWLLYSTPVQS